jgi:hypothetical protein
VLSIYSEPLFSTDIVKLEGNVKNGKIEFHYFFNMYMEEDIPIK